MAFLRASFAAASFAFASSFFFAAASRFAAWPRKTTIASTRRWPAKWRASGRSKAATSPKPYSPNPNPDGNQGRYFSVNPLAVRGELNVFTENKRVLIVCDSGAFGRFLYIAVGATMVGSVILTCQAGRTLQKGEEMGYFAFGGSTILVLFQAGRVAWDGDLLANSDKPIESLVRMGMQMGRKPPWA